MQRGLGPSLDLDSASTIPVLEDLARLHQGVLLVAPGARVAWMSQALAELFDANSVRDWRDLFAHEQVGHALWQTLARTGRLSNQEAELLTREGRHPVSITAVSLACGADSGPVVALVRAAGQVESDSQETASLEAIADCAPDAAVVVDPSGFILHAGPGVTELLGYAPEAVREQPISLYLHRRRDVDRIAAALHGGKRVRIEGIEVLAEDGSVVPVSLWASVLRAPDGREIASIAYMRRTGDPQEREASLQRRCAELEHTLRAVSHDLRSPLVALMGFTRLLREDFGDVLGERGRHFVQRVEQAGRTMECLTHDLLEVSRIDESKPRKAIVDPHDVLLQLGAELKTRLEERQTELRFPPEMPLVHCDRTRLYQVLSNLVGNALDHMGENDRPSITVEVTTEADAHRLTVRDNGRGIAPEHHERIFEIFQRAGPRSEESRGTGVGLAIVKKIAETHGGCAWVESTAGEGAAFHVTFPRGSGAADS